MENFTYAKDGDMALVANIKSTQFKENDIIDKIVFPEIVNLPNSVSETLILEDFIDYVEAPVNMSLESSTITITSNDVIIEFDVKYGIVTGNIEIKYLKFEDGKYKFNGSSGGSTIAWISTLFGKLAGNIFSFTSDMKILKDIDGIFSYFLRYEDTSTLEGLYTYTNFEFESAFVNTDTQLNAIKDRVYFATFMGANSVAEVGELQNVNSLNTAQIQLRHNIVKLYNNLSTTNLDNLYKGMNTITVANMDDLDTSNVTTAVNMFYGCTNLTTITQFDISNVTDITNMFTDCNNLSAVTYENIANMLPQANNLTNQYLSNIGLNVNNFTANQINILNNKGYVDAIPIVPTVQSYYRIKWE